MQFSGSAGEAYKAIENLHLVITIFSLLFIYFKTKVKVIDLSLMIIIAIILLYTFMSNYDNYYIFHTKSLITSIILYLVFSQQFIQEKFTSFVKKNKRMLSLQLVFVIVIILISIITKSGYQQVWNGVYFKGPLVTPHYLAYYMIIMYAISSYLYMTTKNKLYIIYSVVFFSFSALTGARVPFIALCFLVTVNILFNRSKRIKFIVTSFLLTISFIIFHNVDRLQIPIISKFQNMTENSSQLNELTSGRLWFWTYDIIEFNTYEPYSKLFGKGFEFQYNLNYLLTNFEIWAHNDFISLLLSIGIIGCCIYGYFLLKFCIKCRSITLFVLLMILANFNALYGDYNFVLGIPFILVYLKSIQKKIG